MVQKHLKKSKTEKPNALFRSVTFKVSQDMEEHTQNTPRNTAKCHALLAD